MRGTELRNRIQEPDTNLSYELLDHTAVLGRTVWLQTTLTRGVEVIGASPRLELLESAPNLP